MADLAPFFAAWLARTRCNQVYIHGAHHLTSGSAFFADHAFYAELYAAYEDAYDTLAEKACGLGLYALAEPAKVWAGVGPLLSQIPPLVGADAETIAKGVLALELAWQMTLQDHVGKLPNAPLGLDDYLRGLADSHDVFVYKLRQRTGGRPAVMS